MRNTPYTLSPAQPTRAANANSRRSSIYRPRPKHTWHLIYAIWFQAVDAKGGLGSYDLACIDTTARGLTLWKLTDAIFAVTILYGIISQYPSVTRLPAVNDADGCRGVLAFLFTFTPEEKHERNLDRLRLYLKVLSIGGTYRHVTERAPTAKLGGDRWILNFSGRSCAWKARYIDLDQHMAFFVPLDRGIYVIRGGNYMRRAQLCICHFCTTGLLPILRTDLVQREILQL